MRERPRRQVPGARARSPMCVRAALAALALAACDLSSDTTPWKQCTGNLVCPLETECSADGKQCLFCGDGILNGDELCDDRNDVNGDKCDNNCTPTGCGNNIVTEGEVCDDGNRLDGDFCSADCSRSCPQSGCPE